MNYSKFLTLVLATAIAAPMYAQTKLEQPKRATSTVKTPTKGKAANAILSLEAGVVFKSGDVKPVARITFYLLPMPFLSLLKIEKLKLANADETDTDYAASFLAVRLRADQSDDWIGQPGEPQEYYTRANELLKASSLQSVTTDFSGKAKFSPIPLGTYYVVGSYVVGKKVLVWDNRINVTGAKAQIVLDQDNAMFGLEKGT